MPSTELVSQIHEEKKAGLPPAQKQSMYKQKIQWQDNQMWVGYQPTARTHEGKHAPSESLRVSMKKVAL